MVELQSIVKAAKAETDRLDAEVKRMHNEVYGPLCAAKREARSEYERLAGELKTLIVENKELFDMIKSIGK